MATKGIDISGLIPSHYEVGPTSIEPAQVIWIPSLYPNVDKPRISQRFVIEVQALKHPGMFYFPPSPQFRLQESVARFSLIQVAHGSALKLHRSGSDPVMLSDKFFGWMRSHLIEYLGVELPKNQKDDLIALTELVLGEAKAQGVY